MDLATETLVVGGSLAGLTLAESLRDHGDARDLVLVGAERHPPYSRPPLSKQVLSGVWEPERALLADAAGLAARGIDFRPGVTATAVDVGDRVVQTSAGRIRYSQLVVATGVRARPLPAVPDAITVRTLDDIARLAASIPGASRVAIVGAGVLGCELAATIRGLGPRVSLLGRGPGAAIGGWGRVIGARVIDLLRSRGVDVRVGVSVSGSRRVRGTTQLRLSDGSRLSASVVVAAVGARPSIEWLAGSGIDLADGVLCDANGRAADDVHALGDVARWADPGTGTAVRIEHQTNAIEQAHALADVLVSGRPAPPRHPFFWSELFDTRIQAIGRSTPGAELRVEAGDADGDRFVVASVREGRVEGLLAWNMAREFRLARAVLPDPIVPTTEGART